MDASVYLYIRVREETHDDVERGSVVHYIPNSESSVVTRAILMLMARRVERERKIDSFVHLEGNNFCFRWSAQIKCHGNNGQKSFAALYSLLYSSRRPVALSRPRRVISPPSALLSSPFLPLQLCNFHFFALADKK